MNYAIILAGGAGKRFWPLSRELEPKQFLNVCSIRPMLEETIDRISPLIKKDNIYIATGKIYNKKTKECLKKLNIPSGNILFEPQSKNTFAPIAVLSNSINGFDSDAVIAVFPSDHFIKHNRRFLKLLSKGMEIAREGYIVSLGIPPKRPETGYGYIKIKPSAISHQPSAYKIDRFIEKPNLIRAKKFIKDKRYYWNGGIFIFKPQVILWEIKKFMPRTYKILMQTNYKKDFNRLWHKFPSISIDYAIMEKTKRMALLPADCGWIDLGSWEAIGEVVKKDKNGNIFRGKCIDMGSKNSLVWSDKRLIATLGLNNIIIVDTEDALLVCRKDMSQDIKKAVGLLKQQNYKDEV
ncbi:MAG: mannose-1-phosphate guanylyltransferase [Candidatus Omnitrophota bacterium]|nr:mannose-1-phosphate guanylyltransferase [Candidatus Omnitrophota bacterium]